MLEQLKKRLHTIDGGIVLDVASGGGDFITFVKEFKSYKKIIAIDSNVKMEKVFKQKFSDEMKIEFKNMDAEHMEFAENSFNTVCISNSLHHFQNPKKVLSLAQKVLSEKGLFIINEMRSDELNEKQKSHDLVHKFFAKYDRFLGRTHFAPFSFSQILEITNILSFSQKEIYEYEFPYDEEHSRIQSENIVKMLQSYIEKEFKPKKMNTFVDEANAIISYILKNGFAAAKSVFIIFSHKNNDEGA